MKKLFVVGDHVTTIYGLDVVLTFVGEDFAGERIEGTWAHNGDLKSQWFRPAEICDATE